MPRWRTWASMSTGAAGPGGGSMRRPASTCSSRTGGTPAFMTCPAGRACWARSRAGPRTTPRTGWRGATPAWRDAVQVVAIDMCTIYASAVRRMLPRAVLAVDLFHVVQLAVKTAGDVRRRAVRGKYGRRGRSGDPEYGIKSLLVRNLEHLTPAQFAKVIETLDAGRGRAGDRHRLDREGKAPRRAEPARPHHRDHPVRAAGPGQAVRLLRLVRPERRHPRAAQPRQDDLTVGERDRGRGPHRRQQRHRREPEPARETRGPPRLRVPLPGEPAQAGPHRLHPRHPPTFITHRNQKENATSNQPATQSRLTSKSHFTLLTLGAPPDDPLPALPRTRGSAPDPAIWG